MAQPFYKRLKEYYLKVGAVLRGEAEAASIFPNTTDVGTAREKIYVEFLRMHIPSKCNAFLGGFLFGEDGTESKQLDVIITTDTTPRYNFQNADGNGKSFAPVEGCLGVASIKSYLNKEQLIEALENIASIPPTQPLGKRINPLLKLEGYEDWPYKIIYASDGLKGETILKHIQDFYAASTIPQERRPDIIHVAGQYVIFRIKKGMNITGSDGSTTALSVGEFHLFDTNPDLIAITWVLDEMQKKALVSTHINFTYSSIIDQVVNT